MFFGRVLVAISTFTLSFFFFPSEFVLKAASSSIPDEELNPAVFLAAKEASAEEELPFKYDYLKDIKKSWQQIYSKDGIYVFESNHGDESPMAFRGIGVLKASVYSLLTAIREVESSKEWTPNLVSKKLLKLQNHADGITYNHNRLPWPVTDRDTVMRTVLTIDQSLDKNTKFINIVSKSVEMPEAPVYTDKIRGVLHSSHLIFFPLSEDTTYVDLDAHFDPKGMIPTWVVNFVQRDWPFKFLKSLEKRAQEKPIKDPHPEFIKAVKALEK
ncbi:MAG: hypothetical protein HQK50_19215 [Oligoflexia bacterium]|nr:hypothetical protein [Oligoflexia bacterium]MBF0367708.1 hypothetical protein [Oligoflexia bacterium]